MAPPVRTTVTFRCAAFNTTEPRDYFINECCYGDDVARWLIEEIRKRGHPVDEEPRQEDFGWYISFDLDDVGYDFVIAFREPGDGELEGDWVGWLERAVGFFASMLGGRKRGIEPAAPRLLHEILANRPDVRDVRWHFPKDFDARREERGTTAP